MPWDAALVRSQVAKGAPVFVRIFKQESELELWAERGGAHVLVKTYPICTWSGTLGPKLREGDRQSPEGFYRVTRERLNPNSRFHLSFNVGFPNAYDRAHGRTGSFLMVHGNCVSLVLLCHDRCGHRGNLRHGGGGAGRWPAPRCRCTFSRSE